MRHTTLAVT